MSRRERPTLEQLLGDRSRWREFETAANERAYARWMSEQERGDAARDERERRQEIDDDEN